MTTDRRTRLRGLAPRALALVGAGLLAGMSLLAPAPASGQEIGLGSADDNPIQIFGFAPQELVTNRTTDKEEIQHG